MIDTGTPYRVQPDIKTFFMKGLELMALAAQTICAVPNCMSPRADNKRGYCKNCNQMMEWYEQNG